MQTALSLSAGQATPPSVGSPVAHAHPDQLTPRPKLWSADFDSNQPLARSSSGADIRDYSGFHMSFAALEIMLTAPPIASELPSDENGVPLHNIMMSRNEAAKTLCDGHTTFINGQPLPLIIRNCSLVTDGERPAGYRVYAVSILKRATASTETSIENCLIGRHQNYSKWACLNIMCRNFTAQALYNSSAWLEIDDINEHLLELCGSRST